MPQADMWQQLLEAGMEFTEMTRAEAQRRAQKLVREGQLAQERAQAFVDAVVDSSRRRADELADTVRKEIQRQMESLGLATKDDLSDLERRISAPPAKTRGGKSAGPKKPGSKTAGAQKAAGKKAAGKKAAGKKAAGKKAGAKPAGKKAAKQAGAKKTAPKKSG
jgi:polyhydroxyalkanoate synthesis regulator phasin